MADDNVLHTEEDGTLDDRALIQSSPVSGEAFAVLKKSKILNKSKTTSTTPVATAQEASLGAIDTEVVLSHFEQPSMCAVWHRNSTRCHEWVAFVSFFSNRIQLV